MNATFQTRQTTAQGKTAAAAPNLREASFNDYGQIAALQSRYGLLSKSHDEWTHVWLGNPVYRKFQGTWNIGWVLEDEHHQIVGSVENIPLLYEFEGKPVLAASGRCWVAEPKYRGFSLELLERVVNQRQIDLYVNNTVSPEAMGPLGLFQCHPVPAGRWDESAFWIFNCRKFAQSYLMLQGFPLAKPLSYPLSAVVFLKDLFSKMDLKDSDIQVKACSGFDERFDHFWLELKKKKPHVLLAVRTREILEWHYKYALLDGRLWILTINEGNQLIAYATFERMDKPQFGLKRMSLVDFQSLDGSTTLLLPLLLHAAKKCREEGISVLESVGRWLELGELLAEIAPYRRKLPAWRYFYRASNPKLAERLREGRAWSPSLFDGDASLCAGLVTPSSSAPRSDSRQAAFSKTQIPQRQQQSMHSSQLFSLEA